MEETLVRLKPLDPRRKFVLRRYAYAGIVFQEAHGWYRVPQAIGDYLRGVRQLEFDPYSPGAFDVCSDAEAQAIDAREKAIAGARRLAMEAIGLTPARAPGVVTTRDLPTKTVADEAPPAPLEESGSEREERAPAREEASPPRAAGRGKGEARR